VSETLAAWWIGGSPCAGKSSIVDRLALRHGLRVYRCDDAYDEHLRRFTPEGHPVATRLIALSCDELWLRPVPTQIAEEFAFYREEFSLIRDDLRAMPPGRPIIAEGTALLPDCLDRLGVEPDRAIWIVPAEPFQRRHYAERDWRHEILEDCTERERAWEHWMARDAGFAQEVADEARRRGFRVLTVDGSRSLGEMTKIVARHFGLWSERKGGA
jgi:hypothetical protein